MLFGWRNWRFFWRLCTTPRLHRVRKEPRRGIEEACGIGRMPRFLLGSPAVFRSCQHLAVSVRMLTTNRRNEEQLVMFCMSSSKAPVICSYPQLKRDGPPLAAYLGLLAVGFTLPTRSPAFAVRFTAPFHPYRRRQARRYVFCGTPSAHAGLPLATTVPCPVRTFLPADLQATDPAIASPLRRLYCNRMRIPGTPRSPQNR